MTVSTRYQSRLIHIAGVSVFNFVRPVPHSSRVSSKIYAMNKLLRQVRTMKLFVGVSLLFAMVPAGAIERKALSDVDSNALTTEGQVMGGTSENLDLAWWIPTEFWEVSVRGNPAVQEFQARQIIDTLSPYSVIAIVQADVSPFGAFSFFGEDAISAGMRIEHIDEDGTRTLIPHDKEAAPDVVILLNQMVPVLAAAMGNLGENFYFFPLPDYDADDNRLMSPYEKGTIRVTLDTRENGKASVLEIELPLDSLHVPRLCPNGKPAHVTWSFCPWSGTRLKN